MLGKQLGQQRSYVREREFIPRAAQVRRTQSKLLLALMPKTQPDISMFI